MTGKTIKSDIITELADFSFFYGSEFELVNNLNETLSLIFKDKVKYYHLKNLSKFHLAADCSDWLENEDNCIQCYKGPDFPEKFKNLFNIDENSENIIPVRNVFFSKHPLGFIVTQDISEESLSAIQIIAVITGQKLEMTTLINKGGNFMQHYLLGKLFPQISHEIKNKLIAPLTFFTKLPDKKEDSSFLKEFGGLANGELLRIKDQLDSILNFSKNNLNSNNTSITQPLNYCLSLLSSQLERYSIKIETSVSDTINFPVDEQTLKDVLFNLILNSIHALKDVNRNKVIRIRTFSRKKDFGFIIEDNGTGMTSEEKEKVFSPFYTTKAKGTGLGLSIVKNYLDNSGATVDVKTGIDLGTFFEISFTTEESF